MHYLKFAFRNIFRYRTRSLVTIAVIFLGFTAVSAVGGMVNNIFSQLKAQAVVIEKLGHLTFAKEGFFLNGKMDPEAYIWNGKELKDIIDIIRQDSEVVLATPRLKLFGVASNGKASSIFLSEGIVPVDDAQLITTPIDGKMNTIGAVTLPQGENRQYEVAIGSELSAMLGVGEEQYFTLLTNTLDGMANAFDAKVAHVYNTGNPATNDKYVLINFSLAQQLYDTNGAERIVVTLKNPERIEEIKNRLLQSISQAGYNAEAYTWKELSLFYEKVTAMFSVIFGVLTIIISIVVLLVTLNTMLMAVTERTREIGTLRSLGMQQGNVIRLFCFEGLIMAFAGCLIALPVLFGISEILEMLKVSFIPPVASSPVPILLKLSPEKLLIVFVLFTAAAVISSYLTSRKIAKQKVVDSLAHAN